MQAWQLQNAKNRLSEVVDNAVRKGPQVITRHGKETVVVVSIEEYRRLRRSRTDLVDFLRVSPLAAVTLDVARNADTGRDVKL